MTSARLLACIVIGVVVLEVCGCAGGPPKPTPAQTTLVAAVDVNPDIEGHPAPIVIRFYELKEDAAFNNADYFRLLDKEQETLGSSLVGHEELELQPGESHTWELKLPAEARFLGIAAGFRDLPNSRWKALIPAPRRKMRERKLAVNLTKSAVSIVVRR